MARGDFAAPLPRARADEIGQLARAFGEMRRAIADRESRLRSAQAEMIHREKLAAMGRLVAQLSHEINNPIYNIQNCLEALERRGDPADPNREFLTLAQEELQRLAVAHPAAARPEPSPADASGLLNVNALVPRVLTLARAGAGGARGGGRGSAAARPAPRGRAPRGHPAGAREPGRATRSTPCRRWPAERDHARGRRRGGGGGGGHGRGIASATCRTSSRRSTRPSRGSRGSGWGCSCRRGSSAATAAASTWRARRAREAASSCACPARRWTSRFRFHPRPRRGAGAGGGGGLMDGSAEVRKCESAKVRKCESGAVG